MSVFGIALGLLFGLIATIILHLAKAMERHGIEIFDRTKSLKEKGKKPLIWFIGFGLNNTMAIWQLAGTYFAPASVFVSVFGMGLVVVLIYSTRILNEKMTRWNWIGASLIIAGTLFSGILLFNRPEITSPVLNYDAFKALMIGSAVVLGSIIVFSHFTNKAVSLLFGLVAGSCGGLDNVLKHSGFQEGNIWIILISFGVGFLGFLFTQWGFAKKADASKLVPAYNSSYIILPIVFESIIIVSVFTRITPLQVVAIAIIIIGITFMTAIKKWQSPKESVPKITDDASQ